MNFIFMFEILKCVSYKNNSLRSYMNLFSKALTKWIENKSIQVHVCYTLYGMMLSMKTNIQLPFVIKYS
jgi:hypothetical protein